MCSARNLPSNLPLENLTTPSQDMVLGLYYLTSERSGKKGEGMTFGNIEEAILALEYGSIHLHFKVKTVSNGELVDTTIGRAIYNTIVPEEPGYQTTLSKASN